MAARWSEPSDQRQPLYDGVRPQTASTGNKRGLHAGGVRAHQASESMPFRMSVRLVSADLARERSALENEVVLAVVMYATVLEPHPSVSHR